MATPGVGEGGRGQKDNEDEDNLERTRQRLAAKRPSDNTQCTICLNSIRDLSYADCCLHPFCRSCIIEWSKRSNHCPVCRTVFNNVLTNIQPDSHFDPLPIEPPPEPVGPIPFVNIVRDILVSQDGTSTVIRTRITDVDGTTEITEARGRHAAIHLNPSSPHGTGPSGPSIVHPPTDPRPHRRSSIEMDEVDRFMGLLFRSLLSSEPLSPISFVEDPSEARITRLAHPELGPQAKVIVRAPPPPLPPSGPRPPPLFIPFSPQHRPRLMFASKRSLPSSKLMIPGLENWSKQAFQNIQQDRMGRSKISSPVRPSSENLRITAKTFSFPSPKASPSSTYSLPSPLPKSKILSSSSSSSVPEHSRSSDDNGTAQNRRHRRRYHIFGKNLTKSKDHQPKSKK